MARSLNILIVNPVHPATPHISAVRAWRFAQCLSAFGHRVVLLTVPPPGAAPDPRSRIDQLTEHDWASPIILEVDDDPAPTSPLPVILRKIRTAARLVWSGGAKGGWVRRATATMLRAAPRFRPDVVWCTFGMMEAVFAARSVARRLRCPWVLDIKDNWELFVPLGLRRVMAARTAGWVSITSNALFTAERARRWQGTSAEVIYSGIDAAFFGPIEAGRSDKEFQINLVGSLYFPEHLDTLLEGIGTWSRALTKTQRSRVRVSYLGGDTDLFNSVANRRIPAIEREALGFIPLDDLAARCRRAAVNAYVAHWGGFHHKLLELLACRKPILVCPAEGGEANQLATEVDAHLLESDSASGVAAHLHDLFERWREDAGSVGHDDAARRYSWPEQTRRLEQVLMAAVRSNQQ
jgi:glycosyltransferase involved in cell wall biosynthesis